MKMTVLVRWRLMACLAALFGLAAPGMAAPRRPKPPEPPVVGIARNADPEAATAEAIRLAGGLAGVIRKGDWVVVKPNVTVPSRSGDGVITNAQVLKAIIKAAKTAGAGRVTLAEAGALSSRRPDVLRRIGYQDVVDETGVDVVMINDGETRLMKPSNPLGVGEYPLSTAVLDCDVLISAAVLKTHNTGQVTLSMKNMFGAMPGSKYPIHQAKLVEESIADIQRVRRIDFAVIDATTAMEGYGPISGERVKMDTVIAGRDPVAVDSVGAQVMGFNPREVKHIALAAKAGVGTMDPAKITVRGLQVAEVKRRFARPWGPGLEGEITRAYVPPDGLTLFWLGQGGFALKTPQGKLVLVDPYLAGTPGVDRLVPPALAPRNVVGDAERQQATKFPDLVLCTHDHSDHTDPIALKEIAATSQARFVGPPSSTKLMADNGLPADRIDTIRRGETREFDGIRVRAVYAKHTDDSVGYVLSFGPTTVYITGDSEYDPQLAGVKALKPDILLVCINGKWGNMSAADAAKLTAEIGPKVVIPMHYGMFANNTVDPQTFVEAAKAAHVKARVVLIPHMGAYVYDPVDLGG